MGHLQIFGPGKILTRKVGANHEFSTLAVNLPVPLIKIKLRLKRPGMPLFAARSVSHKNFHRLSPV